MAVSRGSLAREAQGNCLRFVRGGLLFEQNFYAAGGPCGDTRAEKIGIFGPNVATQREGAGQNVPIVLVSTSKTAARVNFELRIALFRNRVHESFQIFHGAREIVGRSAPLCKYSGQMLFGFPERRFRRKKSHPSRPMVLDQFPDADAESGANEDVCVENDHLNVLPFCSVYALL